MPSPTVSTNPDANFHLLKLVGSTVFGDYWQKPTAAYLGMSQRHMVRWCNRDWNIPDVLQDGRHIAVALKDLLDAHAAGVEQVRTKLLAALPNGGRPGT